MAAVFRLACCMNALLT